MIKSLWRLSRIQLRQSLQSSALCRLFAPTPFARIGLNSFQYSTTSPGGSHDDRALRQIFDSPNFWTDFSKRPIAGSGKFGSALVQNRFLTEPKGFLRYAQITQVRCQKIVEEVLSASSVEAYISLPRKLDLLSDSLCRVLDIADFVRATHPDVRFQKAATQAYAHLFEYMNILNTTPGLNSQLQKAVAASEVSKAWDGEEKTVAQILLRDFAQSAIDLPENRRRRFVELSSQMKQLGSEFVEDMTTKDRYLDFQPSQLKGIDPLMLSKYGTSQRRVSLPTVGETSYSALGSVQDEQTRRDIYIAGRQCPESQIQKLETLMRIRAEVASFSGYQSYAHMNLSNKLAKSPEAVDSFLKALSRDNALLVGEELAEMRKLKLKDCGRAEVQPWDIVYYRNKINASLHSKLRKPDFMAAYFSLGTVMQGLSRLFSRLYGIHFVPQRLTSGETWNDDVRRLDVVHETEGNIAVLYCDLFARPGKTPNPTHFTLRCSRLISASETANSQESPQEANDGMAVSSLDTKNQRYQLPIIALVCDFSHSVDRYSPPLLTFQDVRTLFHEMGHAIHSILGRTSLQIVSGTRCPTDFAELPSVLMEYFAADASVLALFARHWESDAPLPYHMVQDALQVSKQGQGLQMETQILFSLLDQAYHSAVPSTMGDRFDSTKVFFDVYDEYGNVREPRETNAQGLFGHLVEYGGTYYSYLFDRAIAGKLWKEVFRSGRDGGGIDREAGERYKEEVLKWGGGRDGWACISGVLGDERLRDGGEEAMAEVGRWGVHD